MTILFLKILGGILLVLCGSGIGWTAACRKREAARQVSEFERLLQYIEEAIRFRSLPGMMILAMAAQHPEFSSFCSVGTTTFSQIYPPDYLSAECGVELREGLHALETSSHQSACDILAHLQELCHHTGIVAQESSIHAQRLYPRMGACLGLLAAIVLF